MKILGLNAFHGDASAAVLQEGQLVAALEEERLNRIKHWAGLPLLAAKACLQGAQPDHVAISRNPKAHLADKLLRVALRHLGGRASYPGRLTALGLRKSVRRSRLRGLCLAMGSRYILLSTIGRTSPARSLH